MNLTKQDITQIANSVGLDFARLMAFISVESGGRGFDPATGKIIIQFEPTWFHKYLVQFQIQHSFSSNVDSKGRHTYSIVAGNRVITNGVEGQQSEWLAFDTAFSIHSKAAMLSTSIGMMQIMGFNHDACGFDTVDGMWDAFKKGEYEQVLGGATFIKHNNSLYTALRNKDWKKVAYFYNGPNFAINNYDFHLSEAYNKYNV